jgi:methylmalonyl-CoA/ethylmalonyl-CoA epimerase
MSSNPGPIRQIGYVVDNLEAAVEQWRALTQRGPWTCFKGAVLEGRLGERPVTVTIDVALGYIDDLEIELIAPRSTISPYHGADGRLLVGVHHVAWFSEDIAASVEQAGARGMRVMFEATNPVTKVAYLESDTAAGQRIEFIQYTADGLAGWQQRVATARTWDGTNPVQVYDLTLR